MHKRCAEGHYVDLNEAEHDDYKLVLAVKRPGTPERIWDKSLPGDFRVCWPTEVDWPILTLGMTPREARRMP